MRSDGQSQYASICSASRSTPASGSADRSPIAAVGIALGLPLPRRRWAEDVLQGTDRVLPGIGQHVEAGAMRLTGYRLAADRTDAIAVARRAVELGGQLHRHRRRLWHRRHRGLLAEALYPYADGVVIATKVGHTRPSPAE
jgi:hypothetical protein